MKVVGARISPKTSVKVHRKGAPKKKKSGKIW